MWIIELHNLARFYGPFVNRADFSSEALTSSRDLQRFSFPADTLPLTLPRPTDPIYTFFLTLRQLGTIADVVYVSIEQSEQRVSRCMCLWHRHIK